MIREKEQSESTLLVQGKLAYVRARARHQNGTILRFSCCFLRFIGWAGCTAPVGTN